MNPTLKILLDYYHVKYIEKGDEIHIEGNGKVDWFKLIDTLFTYNYIFKDTNNFHFVFKSKKEVIKRW